MKEIKAIIQPFRLNAIVAALEQIPGLPGITVSDVRGFGRPSAATDEERIDDPHVLYVDKVQMEIVVPDRLAEQVINTILENAHTGNPGDGKIFARTVDDAIHIGTLKRGEDAL